MLLRLLYPTKLSINTEGKNKIFYDKTRFNQYLATNPALRKILEGKLQPKEVGYINKNTIDGLIAANPKEGENAQINITNNKN